MPFVSVFSEVILPVFLIAAVGASVHKIKPLNTEALSQTILYIFSPALVFHGLSTTDLPLTNLVNILIFSFLLLICLYLVGYLLGFLTHSEGGTKKTLVISSIFMNAGNYGLPVAYFAFGDEGLSTAIVFFVIQATLGWTVGIFLATQGRQSTIDSIKTVFKVPTTYAAILGVTASILSVNIPSWLLKSTDILGDAAIPAMLIILGIHIGSKIRITKLKPVIAAGLVRLLISPLIAYGITLLLPLTLMEAKILILVSSMPTAVFTIILATEYGGDPELSSNIVIGSTLFSLLTVTGLLFFIS
jgi:predicted permease